MNLIGLLSLQYVAGRIGTESLTARDPHSTVLCEPAFPAPIMEVRNADFDFV